MEPIHSKKYKAKVKSTRTHVTKEHNNQDIFDTTNYIIFRNVENFPRKCLKHLSYSKIQVFLSKCDNCD